MMSQKRPWPIQKNGALFLVLLFIFLPLFLKTAVAEELSRPLAGVTSKVNKQVLYIGEELRYDIYLSVPGGAEVSFPGRPDALSDFEIRASGSDSRPLKKRTVVNIWYRLAIYDTGRHLISSIPIRYKLPDSKEWQSASTPGVEVTVISVLEQLKDPHKASDIKNIAGPISFSWKYKPHLIFGLASLFIVFFAAFFLKRAGEEQREDDGPLSDEPLHRLNILISSMEKKDVSREDIIRAGQLTREYLEKEFNLKTRRRTTREFLYIFRGIKGLSQRHVDFLSSFLKVCDMLKFANYYMEPYKLKRALLSLKNFIGDKRLRKERD